MSRDSIRITENHIYCDKCGLDSADVIGDSTSNKMEVIKYILKSDGWEITKSRDLCSKCI